MATRSLRAHGQQGRYLWTLPMLRFLMAVALLTVHVYAEPIDDSETMDFVTRFSSGPENLTSVDMALFVALGVLAMEIVNWLAKNIGVWLKCELFPVRGKHLDDFSNTDLIFIGISKAQTGPFVYFLLRYALTEPNMLWKVDEMSLQTVLFPVPALFIVFDFFYTILHWALHIKAIYGYVHKHHHHQKAPSRANDDAINVHPIEYILGEYNHLWSLFLCCQVFNIRIHVLGALVFLAVGGVLAGLNHTRYDITWKVAGITIYDTKAHDVHHRIPQSNYGQYILLWDYIFGSFRPYNPNDRVNPMAQLDPKTGKSLEYATKKQ